MTGPAIVLTTQTCAQCHMVKKFLAYKDIPYEVQAVDNDTEMLGKIVERCGEAKVPVTIIGERWIQGYKPEAIMEAIAE